jgi:hypothetical protein
MRPNCKTRLSVQDESQTLNIHVNHKIREYKYTDLEEKNKAVRMMMYPAAE